MKCYIVLILAVSNLFTVQEQWRRVVYGEQSL